MNFDEEKLIEVIRPEILRCRPGDWEHAKRVVKFIKELGKEKSNLPLLIMAGYIHDIGWRDLFKKEKITFDELLELEPQANRNSEPNIKELLSRLDYDASDIKKILELVSAADKHESSNEDEEIIVDADQLSKLDINHLKEKYQKSEWLKMYELWNKEFDQRIKTEKAKLIYPELMLTFKKDIDNLEKRKEIVLVEGAEKDLETFFRLEQKLAGETYRPETKKEDIYGENKCFYLIKNRGDVVGQLAYEIQDGGVVYLNVLAIDPKFQNMGLGKQAMKQFLSLVSGAPKIWLVTHPENKSAIHIYQNLGFKITEQKENYFGNGTPRVVMVLEKS